MNALAALAVVAALARQDAKPPPAPARPGADEARAARLESQRARLQAQLAAQAKFGQEERFLEALRSAISDHPPGDEEGVGSFWPVKNGKAPAGAFTSFVGWHTARGDERPPAADDRQLPNHPYAAIVDFSKQVRARGAELLMVSLPTRLEVHPELVIDLPSAEGFAGMGSGTTRFLLALNEAGVETLDLRAAYVAERGGKDPADDALYLNADSHWTPRGAEVAAKAVAELVAAYPWFKSGPMMVGRELHLESRALEYNPSPELMHAGAEPQQVKANVVTVGATLLDAMSTMSPFILLGDSHIRLYRSTGCDFCAQFCRFTGWKLDVIQAYGGAAEQVRRKLAHRTPSEWEGKKLVIWILPETILVPAPWWKVIKIDGR